MLIIGAKGFAKEAIECVNFEKTKSLLFYDDVNVDAVDLLFNKYKIIKSIEEAQKFFEQVDNKFIIGVGGTKNRIMLAEKFINLGGKFTTVVHSDTTIGNFDNKIGHGSIICAGVRITNSVSIGKGVLINLNVTIGHDSKIGNFVELCPNVNISGNCKIGNKVFIGTGAIILPKLSIGDGSIIGAGAVVTRDVKPYTTVVGNPARELNKR